MIPLFSYGTLQQREVQLANYGRALAGEPDALLGYRLQPVEIADPHVVEVSGKSVHTIAVATGNPNDRISGVLLSLTEAELAVTDDYETKSYARIETRLESGRTAWVYVAI